MLLGSSNQEECDGRDMQNTRGQCKMYTKLQGKNATKEDDIKMDIKEIW
jgi:hypothetical protein